MQCFPVFDCTDSNWFRSSGKLLLLNWQWTAAAALLDDLYLTLARALNVRKCPLMSRYRKLARAAAAALLFGWCTISGCPSKARCSGCSFWRLFLFAPIFGLQFLPLLTSFGFFPLLLIVVHDKFFKFDLFDATVCVCFCVLSTDKWRPMLTSGQCSSEKMSNCQSVEERIGSVGCSNWSDTRQS